MNRNPPEGVSRIDRRRCQLFPTGPRKALPFQEGGFAMICSQRPEGCLASIKAMPCPLPRGPKAAGSQKGGLPSRLHCLPKDAMVPIGRFCLFSAVSSRRNHRFPKGGLPFLSRWFPKEPAVPGGRCPVSPALPEGCAGSARAGAETFPPASEDADVPRSAICLPFPVGPRGVRRFQAGGALSSRTPPKGCAFSQGGLLCFPLRCPKASQLPSKRGVRFLSGRSP
jgi:hypothetical protein